MRLFVCLAFLCVMLSAGYGLRCYTCWGVNPGACNEVWDCPNHFDRCSTTIVAENLISKQCLRNDMCSNVYSQGRWCCSGDLCNGAQHTGVFVPLLLAPLAVITLFI